MPSGWSNGRAVVLRDSISPLRQHCSLESIFWCILPEAAVCLHTRTTQTALSKLEGAISINAVDFYLQNISLHQTGVIQDKQCSRIEMCWYSYYGLSSAVTMNQWWKQFCQLLKPAQICTAKALYLHQVPPAVCQQMTVDSAPQCSQTAHLYTIALNNNGTQIDPPPILALHLWATCVQISQSNTVPGGIFTASL